MKGVFLVGESTPPSNLEDSAPPSHKRKKFGAWLKLANLELESGQATTTSPIPVEAKLRKEVEDYLLATKPDPDSNPLDWWTLHAKLYPTAQLAKRYLCIPATSSASERGFSSSGHIVTKKHG